jgi:hypothetical protein
MHGDIHRFMFNTRISAKPTVKSSICAPSPRWNLSFVDKCISYCRLGRVIDRQDGNGCPRDIG